MADLPRTAPTGITHIVWDWNGTLLDDNHANLAAVNRVCARFGREPIALDDWRAMFRRPLTACYEELLGRPFADGEWARVNEDYDRAYRELLPSCGLAEGALDVLGAWRDRGGSQSLLSMAGHEFLVPLIDERGLTPHFTRVDGRRYDTDTDSKADHLVDHLSAQGIDPATTVLIGDIDDDARAAEAAGAHAVLVATGLMGRERLTATGHPVADSAAEAVALLRA
ncbi:phosphoglycolate phosphatase-like HAD superfamily hydrolase [Murinocardiopsis flavida]|uniref:Phosphoglycolate phosphatase-like HAD superfamily hydrolase n=1 Tax=Murinocardiopsis flavida TaxID=645275 RepID=A0A2P8DGR4_9ACTN|nr:HAD family hydrolase [Murinocardiopsis flavida]PSK96417.1 phosphoglycolate phosphatase-like HAD superfamily hydrolase [Murinocardiopsis flavida]